MYIAKYKNYLNNICNKTLAVNIDSANGFIQRCLSTTQEYSDFIKIFFSYPNTNDGLGEAKNIKSLYETISNLSYTKNIPIMIRFSPSSFYMYRDYIDGMNKFVHGIIDAVKLNDSAKIELFGKQIQTAKDNDQNFIFDITKKTDRNAELSEAMEILDQLIKFKDDIHSLIQILNGYETLVDNVNDGLSLDAVKMLTNSIDNYCYCVLNDTIDAYKLICDNVENVTTLQKPEFQEKAFSIF